MACLGRGHARQWPSKKKARKQFAQETVSKLDNSLVCGGVEGGVQDAQWEAQSDEQWGRRVSPRDACAKVRRAQKELTGCRCSLLAAVSRA